MRESKFNSICLYQRVEISLSYICVRHCLNFDRVQFTNHYHILAVYYDAFTMRSIGFDRVTSGTMPLIQAFYYNALCNRLFHGNTRNCKSVRKIDSPSELGLEITILSSVDDMGELY